MGSTPAVMMILNKMSAMTTHLHEQMITVITMTLNEMTTATMYLNAQMTTVMVPIRMRMAIQITTPTTR